MAKGGSTANTTAASVVFAQISKQFKLISCVRPHDEVRRASQRASDFMPNKLPSHRISSRSVRFSTLNHKVSSWMDCRMLSWHVIHIFMYLDVVVVLVVLVRRRIESTSSKMRTWQIYIYIYISSKPNPVLDEVPATLLYVCCPWVDANVVFNM